MPRCSKRCAGLRTQQYPPHGYRRTPWENGTDECFNGRLRDECLRLESFLGSLNVP